MVTSRIIMKKALMSLSVAVAFLVCSTAQAQGWTIWTNGAGNGLWEDAGNWHNGVPEFAGHAPIIGDLATAGPVTASSGTYSFTYMRVGVENSYPIGKLIVSGANLTSGGTNTRHGFGYGSGNAGTLEISSGSLTFNNNNQATSIGASSATSGSVYQTGGTLSFAGGTGNSVSMGTTNGAGLFDFTAGTLETREAFNIISGGTGTSIFNVNGYDAGSSIQIGGSSDDYNGAWLQSAGTTLSLNIDGATTQGTTLINVGTGTNGTHTGQATFASGSILDLGFNSAAQVGTWTVMTAAGGIDASGLSLAAEDVGNWSFAVVGNDLQVTALAIPEPSSIVLLLMGFGVFLLTYRRRKV